MIVNKVKDVQEAYALAAEFALLDNEEKAMVLGYLSAMLDANVLRKKAQIKNERQIGKNE